MQLSQDSGILLMGARGGLEDQRSGVKTKAQQQNIRLESRRVA